MWPQVSLTCGSGRCRASGKPGAGYCPGPPPIPTGGSRGRGGGWAAGSAVGEGNLDEPPVGIGELAGRLHDAFSAFALHLLAQVQHAPGETEPQPQVLGLIGFRRTSSAPASGPPWRRPRYQRQQWPGHGVLSPRASWRRVRQQRPASKPGRSRSMTIGGSAARRRAMAASRGRPGGDSRVRR